MLQVPRSTLIDKSNAYSRGLIGVWVCNDGTGNTVFDATSFENNASFYGTPQWVSTIQGWALYLDGSSQLRIDSAPFVFPTENFSVLIRVMPLQTGSAEAIWSAEDNTDDRHSLIYRDASDYFHVSLGDGTNVADAIFSGTSPINQFTDIGLSWDKVDGLLRGFRDGFEEASTSFDYTLKSSISNPIIIGNRPISPLYPFTGNISLIYVWNRKVKEREFFQLHSDPYLIFDKDLLYAVLSPSDSMSSESSESSESSLSSLSSDSSSSTSLFSSLS